jgi:hypothetical protein
MARGSNLVFAEILEAIETARESVAGAEGFAAFAVSRVRRAATERAI